MEGPATCGPFFVTDQPLVGSDEIFQLPPIFCRSSVWVPVVVTLR